MNDRVTELSVTLETVRSLTVPGADGGGGGAGGGAGGPALAAVLRRRRPDLGVVYLAKVYWLRVRIFISGLRKLPDHADTP